MASDLIIRGKYEKAITPFIGKQLIKVLTGQRRVGKSYILRQTMDTIKRSDPGAHLIFINKEDLAFDTIHTASDLNVYVINNTREGVKNYVFIDEVQEVDEFEKALRSLLLNPVYDLYCTGSNARMLSGELATLLSGRYIEIPVYSLSYPEFLQFHRLESSADSLMRFLQYGGLPYLMHLEWNGEIIHEYLKGVYNTVMYRDIVMRNEVRNIVFLENLVRFLADNTGQLFSARKISEYLKSQHISIATSQVISYLNHLANAFLVLKVERLDIAGKKIFEIGEKFYFQDLGLRNTVFEYKLTDLGKMMENAVYNHLRYHDYEVWVGSTGPYEIDFVGRKRGETLYVQVCYLLSESSTIEREFGNLERIDDNYPKIVVSMDEFSGNTSKGIRHVNLRKFLESEW